VIGTLAGELASAWRGTSWPEIIGALLAIAYLLLAIRQRSACWYAAFISSLLYVWVYFVAHLYMDSALQIFYAVMAAYGFWQWRHGRGGAQLTVTRWPLQRHAVGLTGVVLLSVVTSFFLRRYTPAASPFVDSLVTWSSVYTTYLVTLKVYENWYWWLVIDSVGLVLYFSRGLHLTALLFGLYLVLIVVGMREWRRTLPAAHVAA
jgi:nicotinamide mononucleotide transporter